MIEAGLPNFEIVLYSGIMGPKGMDARAGAQAERGVRQGGAGARDAATSDENIGADPLAMSPQEFEKRTVAEIAKFGAGGQGLRGQSRLKPLLPQHSRYDFVPLVERKDYSWPGGKRLAFVPHHQRRGGPATRYQ